MEEMLLPGESLLIVDEVVDEKLLGKVLVALLGETPTGLAN